MAEHLSFELARTERARQLRIVVPLAHMALVEARDPDQAERVHELIQHKIVNVKRRNQATIWLNVIPFRIGKLTETRFATEKKGRLDLLNKTISVITSNVPDEVADPSLRLADFGARETGEYSFDADAVPAAGIHPNAITTAMRHQMSATSRRLLLAPPGVGDFYEGHISAELGDHQGVTLRHGSARVEDPAYYAYGDTMHLKGHELRDPGEPLVFLVGAVAAARANELV